MGIERGALGSLLGHTGPIGESERYAARVFGAHRSYSVLNGTSASNRAIMSACVGDDEIALCDRNCHKSIEQGLVAHRRHPGLPEPDPQPLRHHRPDPAGAARAQGDREGDRREPAGQAAPRSKRPVYAVLTNCTYDGMCYDAGEAAGAAGEERRPHPLRRGLVRLRALQSDVPRPLRDARRSGRPPEGRPDRLRHALDPQAARRAVADLVHPHPRRPRRHRPRPLQRGVLLAGQHLAALRAHRVERRRGRHDGRPGRAGAHPGRHRRGRGLPAGRRARPPGVPGEEGLVLRAVERRGGHAIRRPASGSRSTRRPPSCSPPTRTAGCCIRARAGTASKTSRTAGACSIRSSSASSARA